MSDGRPFSLSGKPKGAGDRSLTSLVIEAARSGTSPAKRTIYISPLLDDDDGDMDDFQATPEKSPAARRLIPFSSPTQAGRIMQTALLNSGARPPRIPLGVTPGASPPKPHKKATLVRSASASTITAPAKRSRSDGKRSDDKKSEGSSRGSRRGSKHSSSSQGPLDSISSIDDYEYPTAPTYTPSAPVETVDPEMLRLAKEIYAKPLSSVLADYATIKPLLSSIIDGSVPSFRHTSFASSAPRTRASLAMQFTTGFLDHNIVEQLGDQMATDFRQMIRAHLKSVAIPHEYVHKVLLPEAVICLHGVWAQGKTAHDMWEEKMRDEAEEMLLANANVIRRLHLDQLQARFGKF